MTDIAAIYDGSALLAYAHGQIGAAELISEINAEGRQVGVPAVCLANALAALADDWDVKQLMYLMATRTMVLLPLGDADPDELRQVGELTRLAGGDLDVGHAVAAALTHRAYYVTANPKAAEVALPPTWPVLDLRPVRLVSDRFGLAVAPTHDSPTPAEEPQQASMPSQLEPMLATLGPLPTEEDGWGFEFKWDGVRAIAYLDGDLRLLTRNHQDVAATYPELAALRGMLDGRQAVLDGEIVVLGRNGLPSFAALQQRMRSSTPIKGMPVRFYLFDLLHLDGTDLTQLPYAERRDALQRLDITGDPVDTPPYWTGDAGPALLDAARELGLEGVVAKRLDSPYQPGRRSPAWIKVPLTNTAEVVVAGYKPGRREIGSLLIGMYDANDRLVYVGQVSTGLSQAALDDLKSRFAELKATSAPFDGPVPRQHARGAEWLRPVLVADVAFRSWTPDAKLRQPSWKGLRADRDATDARLEN
ncbi:non-homologous end-joining DNA ligase [Asanoa sp. WMMD1127]|uniref:non-homologous end-joining DNA ligase n=1 Tax=Asanoa sp. WMMD1127 TaxID=3016107 RepID=UPI0024164B86|nr:non-homologous end-joining DNA ligase [Asanoa sp. WMMD1127]MDG4822957.1 non-homologous end-joining DNA ligase [Asanoa sp. WMMD1127]